MSPRHDAYVGRAGDRSLLALSSLVGLTGPDPESRTTWIHVAPFGEWSGHSEGKFSLTRDYFSSVVSQLAGKRTPVSLDYEHASIRPSGGPTPAAGYALAAEIRGDGSSAADGLYALVEFTTAAAEFIRKGEYRFCSGVFQFDATDPQSGGVIPCALDTIALTNRPFIDGQRPIALSRAIPLTAGASMSEIDLKALAKLLDAIPGPNTADKIKKALDLMAVADAPKDAPPADAKQADASHPVAGKVALTDAAPAVALDKGMSDAVPKEGPLNAAPAVKVPDIDVSALATDVPCADPPPADAVDDTAVDAFDAKMMTDTGLDVDSYAAALVANYDAIKALLMGDPAMAATATLSRELATDAYRSKYEQATKELNTFRAAEAKRADEALLSEVDALVKTGVYLPAQRPMALALARKSPTEFRALTATLKPAAILAPHASALTTGGPASESLDAGSGQTLYPADHPRVVALAKMFDAVGRGPTDAGRIAAIKGLTG